MVYESWSYKSATIVFNHHERYKKARKSITRKRSSVETEPQSTRHKTGGMSLALRHISELFECQNVDLPKRNQNRIADPD